MFVQEVKNHLSLYIQSELSIAKEQARAGQHSIIETIMGAIIETIMGAIIETIMGAIIETIMGAIIETIIETIILTIDLF